MAKKKSARIRAAKSTPAGRVKANVVPTLDTPAYYANLIEVAHTAHEFTLSIVRVPGKLTAEQQREVTEKNELTLEPTLQILLAPSMIPLLITALQSQTAAFQNTQQRAARAARED